MNSNLKTISDRSKRMVNMALTTPLVDSDSDVDEDVDSDNSYVPEEDDYQYSSHDSSSDISEVEFQELENNVHDSERRNIQGESANESA